MRLGLDAGKIEFRDPERRHDQAGARPPHVIRTGGVDGTLIGVEGLGVPALGEQLVGELQLDFADFRLRRGVGTEPERDGGRQADQENDRDPTGSDLHGSSETRRGVRQLPSRTAPMSLP